MASRQNLLQQPQSLFRTDRADKETGGPRLHDRLALLQLRVVNHRQNIRPARARRTVRQQSAPEVQPANDDIPRFRMQDIAPGLLFAT